MEKDAILKDLKVKLFNKMLENWDKDSRTFDLNDVRNALTSYSDMEELLLNSGGDEQ